MIESLIERVRERMNESRGPNTATLYTCLRVFNISGFVQEIRDYMKG